MSCLVGNNKAVIKSLEDSINEMSNMDEDTYYEINGTSIIDDMETLKALKDASIEKDSDYVIAEKEAYTSNRKADSALEKDFMKSNGSNHGIFNFYWKGGSKPTEGVMKKLVKKGSHYNLTFLSNGKEYTYKFSPEGAGRSVGTKSGSFITVPTLTPTIHNDIANRLILGSRGTKDKILSEEYKQTEYEHGSLKSMKEMLNKVNVLGGEKADAAEMRWLETLFDKMKPKFFTDMELYIDTKAKETRGVIDTKRIDLRISKKAKVANNQQSEASVYAEEVIHAMTMFGIKLSETDKTIRGVEARKLVRKLDHLMSITRENLKWQDLLPENSIDAVKEESEAKELFNYITSGSTSRYEFLAKSLVVPELRTALSRVKVTTRNETSKKIIDRIVDVFTDMVNSVLGNYSFKERNNNVLNSTLNLTLALGEINQESSQSNAKQGMMDIAVDMLNEADYKVSGIFDNVKQYITNDAELIAPPSETSSKYEKAKWLVKSLYLILTNGTYTKAAGYIVTQLGLPPVDLSPESTLREVIGGLFQTEPAQKAAEILGLQAGFIDKQRNTLAQVVRSSVFDKFSKDFKLTVEVEESITDIVVDLDLSLIMDNNSSDGSTTVYNNKNIRKLLTDDNYLESRIKSLKDRIRELDKDSYNWNSSQAMGLGMLLATHKNSITQNTNAENIVKGFLSTNKKVANPRLVKAVDELATLAAVKYANKENKTKVANIMRDEYAGVKHIADLYEGFKKNSDTVAFGENKTHKRKGYRKELYDSTIITEIAPLLDKEEMEKAGYTLKYKLSNKRGQAGRIPMGLYVTSSFGRDDRLRGATRLNAQKAKGKKVSELHYETGESNAFATGRREINRIKKLSLRDARLMQEGKYNLLDKEYGMSPIINENGDVVDYSHTMSKKNKKELLKEDTRISEVLARSYGGLLDKEESRKHNKLVTKNIFDDMNKNYEYIQSDKDYGVGKDGVTEYVAIRKNANSKELKSIWAMLPREMRAAAERRQDKTIAVPRNLMHLYFGYSHISITDFPGLQKITPKIMTSVIKFAEGLWIDLVKVVKTNILLKMPAVLIGNVVSNFLLEIVRNPNPLKILKLYTESYRSVKEYNIDNEKLQKLKLEVSKLQVRLGKDNLTDNVSGNLKNRLIKNRREVKVLEKLLKENPVHELIEMGLDQSVEDTDSEADTNAWSVLGNDKLFNKTPEIIKKGVDIMYFNKSTSWYKVNHEVLELSDLVARDVRLRLDKERADKQASGNLSLPSWWLKDKPKGYSKKKTLRGSELEEFNKMSLENIKYDLIEDFINYTLPSGRMEEYLNRIGILMFTKYVKRIQRVIIKQSNQGPIKSLIGALSIGYLGGLPSIYEQSFFVKDWYSDSLGPGNVFPVYAPTELLMNFVTPALIKSSSYDVSP